jgi:antibiotic biosynthesis monooxygenase (ABM) superfamily enzyme
MQSEPVTVVVSRKVKPGREADYERWIKAVTEVALKYEGHLGMNVFRPQRAGDPYVLVYKFDSGEHLDAWLNSPERAAMVKQAEELAIESHAEHVSGLESWFTLPGAAATIPPPKWKMALVTGVMVYALAQIIGPAVRYALDAHLPPPLTALITTAIMVSLLTWIVMPRVTRLLAGWLFVKKT